MLQFFIHNLYFEAVIFHDTSIYGATSMSMGAYEPPWTSFTDPLWLSYSQGISYQRNFRVVAHLVLSHTFCDKYNLNFTVYKKPMLIRMPMWCFLEVQDVFKSNLFHLLKIIYLQHKKVSMSHNSLG